MKQFQPFSHLDDNSSSIKKSSSTPLRKRSKSSRDSLADMDTNSQKSTSYDWATYLTDTQEYSQDSNSNLPTTQMIYSQQEMTDKLEALSVLSPQDPSSYEMQMRLNNQIDPQAFATSDNSNDSFHIPALPSTCAAHKTRQRVPSSNDLHEERKITIAPPLLNPFLTDSTSMHYPVHHAKRTKTTLWLSPYKDKPRFVTDFEVQYILGEGAFSNVYCVRNRYDGMLYALKRLKTQLQGGGEEIKQNLALKEVCALAALVDCPSIVRYYSSWIEDGYLYIQTELCLPRSLDMFVRTPLPSFVTASGASFTGLGEAFLWRVTQAIASALDSMHSRGMVHLDIRPANVLISVPAIGVCSATVAFPGITARPAVHCEDSRSNLSTYSSADGEVSFTPMQEGEVDFAPSEVEANVLSGKWTLRIGDLGLCRLAADVSNVEEGEARYCPAELINSGSGIDLKKCDIFSLGASLYELCKGERLEVGDEGTAEWHDIRNGKLNDRILARYSNNFSTLLRELLSRSPVERPSAAEVLTRVPLSSEEATQLMDVLNENTLLKKLVEELQSQLR